MNHLQFTFSGDHIRIKENPLIISSINHPPVAGAGAVLWYGLGCIHVKLWLGVVRGTTSG